MTGILKVLGIAIAAVLSMSAAWAGSAQAGFELDCTSTTTFCTATGTEVNTHTLNVEGGNVRCRSSLHATLNGKTTWNISEVKATYTGCRAFGVAANVNMEGCTYTLNIFALPVPATAAVNIVCPFGKSITISAPTLPCTITIGSQNNLSHIVFENSGLGEPVEVLTKITVAGINYNNAGAGCPRVGNFNFGTYNGETTLEGFNDNLPNVEGNKVGLHIGFY